MSDNKQNTGQQDRDRVNINEEYEVSYWTKKWAISKQDLEKAVKENGPMVKDIEKALNK